MSSSQKHHDSRRRPSHKDRSQTKQVLKEDIEQRSVGLDGLHSVRLQLVPLFGRIQRMRESIDEAFARGPFLPDVAPNSPVNTQRFKAYTARHAEVTRLLKKALELWMFACGMKLEDNLVPLLLENARQAAAAKALGATDTHEK
jgi:hypothetical protein